MFELKISLCAMLCGDCSEELSDLELRLIPAKLQPETLVRAVAEVRRTLLLLSEEEAEARAGRAVLRGRSDERGVARLLLPEGYEGGPLEIDLVIRRAPGQREEARQPIFLHLTTLQPMWRQGEKGQRASFEHCFDASTWCQLRARLGAWVICGQVVVEGTSLPVQGVQVVARDADIMQDDRLGLGLTDANGRFRIDYLTQDFEQTIFGAALQIEVFPGPDLYFETLDPSGRRIRIEDRLKGRGPGRGNSRPCACVRLEVPAQLPPPDRDERFLPYWTGIGDFNLASDIDPVTGRTATTHSVTGPTGTVHGRGFAFTGQLPLKGYMPAVASGSSAPLRYRFLATVDGLELPLVGASLGQVQVGSRNILWKSSGDTLSLIQAPIVLGTAAEAPPVHSLTDPGPWEFNPRFVVAPDADGWIQVDSQAVGGGFGVGGFLAAFFSPARVPGAALSGVAAGSPVPPIDRHLGKRTRLRFEVAEVGGPVLTAFGRSFDAILVNNHPAVGRLHVVEVGSGCDPVQNTLTLRWTVDHEMMLEWALAIGSSGGHVIPGLPAGPTAAEPRGGASQQSVPVAGLPACAYTATLVQRLALTDGIQDSPSYQADARTFCLRG